MATLKDHQQAMVDLLASGSGIPASASRLAHAMHDVLKALDSELCDYRNRIDIADRAVDSFAGRLDATTPGLNDKALAADVEACRPKDTMFDRARAAERRVKELENTVNQLRASSASLKQKLGESESDLQSALTEIRELRFRVQPEQAGCRKDDTQVDFSIHVCKCRNPFSHFDEAKDLQICNGCGGAK